MDTVKTEDALPTAYCPTCGGENIVTQRTFDDDYFVGCYECGAGYRADDVKLATASWNDQDCFDYICELETEIDRLKKELSNVKNSH